MTMMGLFVDHGIRILAAVAVMCSPLQPIRHPIQSPLPSTSANLVILDNGYNGESVMSALPSLREAVSLQSDIQDKLDADIEDDLTVKSPPATVSFDALPSPSPEPHSERVSFAVAIAARPLRC